MRDQDLTEDQEREIMKAIQDFKTAFHSGKVKKGAEFVFTKTHDGHLKMEHEVWMSLPRLDGYTHIDNAG